MYNTIYNTTHNTGDVSRAKDSRRQAGRQVSRLVDKQATKQVDGQIAKTAKAVKAGRSKSKAMRVENEDKINVDNETDYKFDINKKNEKGRENCVN